MPDATSTAAELLADLTSARPMDIEVEKYGAQATVTGVRPWMSTILGADSLQEVVYREMINTYFLKNRLPHDVDVMFILPDSSDPVARRTEARCLAISNASGGTVRVVTPSEISSDQFSYAFSYVQGRVVPFNRSTGRAVFFALPLALSIKDWPAFVKDAIRVQDAERLRIFEALRRSDDAPINGVTQPISFANVNVGRRSIRLARATPPAKVLLACEKIQRSGLIRIRETDSDRAFVVDFSREFHLLPIINGAPDAESTFIVEEPPAGLSAAFEARSALNLETFTQINPIISGGTLALEHPIEIADFELPLGPSVVTVLAAIENAAITGTVRYHNQGTRTATVRAAFDATRFTPVIANDRAIQKHLVVRAYPTTEAGLALRDPSCANRIRKSLMLTTQSEWSAAVLVLVASLIQDCDQETLRSLRQWVGPSSRPLDTLWHRLSKQPAFRALTLSPPLGTALGLQPDRDVTYLKEMVGVAVLSSSDSKLERKQIASGVARLLTFAISHKEALANGT